MATKNGGGRPVTRERETEMRDLPVKLTDAELLARADQMSAAELEIERLSLERAQTTKSINDQKRTRAELAHTIDRGEEERPVKCAWHEDFPKNVFRLKREDTGEEIDTRPMTGLDRTGKLFDDDAKPANDNGEPTVPPPRRSVATKGKGKGKKGAAAASTAEASV